jgi:cytochrome c-type biogenesis protein CcmH/NrfG
MIKNIKERISNKTTKVYITLSSKLKEKKGDGYLNNGIIMLIAIVLGALLLAGLYSLFGETIMPTIVERVKDMFNYNGS